MAVVIVGDSHAGTLRRGQDDLIEAGHAGMVAQILIRPLGRAEVRNQPFFADRGDHLEITLPEYRENVERLPMPGAERARIGLSMPLWPTRLVWPLVKARHGFSPVPPDWTPITRSLFRRLVIEDQRQVLALVDRLKALGTDPFVVSGPGLFRHHPITSVGRPGLTLELDREFRRLVTAELAARGVAVVDIPPQCLDDDGYMRAEFRHRRPHDLIHASREYGQLMLKRIVDFLAQ